MIDFSLSYSAMPVDWTVMVAMFLFIVAGTGVLYRALARIILRK